MELGARLVLIVGMVALWGLAGGAALAAFELIGRGLAVRERRARVAGWPAVSAELVEARVAAGQDGWPPADGFGVVLRVRVPEGEREVASARDLSYAQAAARGDALAAERRVMLLAGPAGELALPERAALWQPVLLGVLALGLVAAPLLLLGLSSRLREPWVRAGFGALLAHLLVAALVVALRRARWRRVRARVTRSEPVTVGRERTPALRHWLAFEHAGATVTTVLVTRGALLEDPVVRYPPRDPRRVERPERSWIELALLALVVAAVAVARLF